MKRGYKTRKKKQKTIRKKIFYFIILILVLLTLFILFYLFERESLIYKKQKALLEGELRNIGAMGDYGNEIPVITDDSNQYYPHISDNKIVWYDWNRNNEIEIYMYDINTNQKTKITSALDSQLHPRVSGDKIVWYDWRNLETKSDIYLYDLSNGQEIRITNSPSYESYPRISGDKIVWQDSRNVDSDIYMYDLSTNQETIITNNLNSQINPDISNNKIVWQDNRTRNWDIYMYDLSTNQEAQVTTNTANQTYPSIYNNRIVWQDNRNGNWDIYMYDLSTNQETQVTTNTANQSYPSIYNNRIVWHDGRNGNWDIYMYDLSTNQEIQITTNTANQTYPSIYNNRIVWHDNRNGNLDIYMYEISSGCIPQCSGKECGDDLCGGDCGPCQTGFRCEENICAVNDKQHPILGIIGNKEVVKGNILEFVISATDPNQDILNYTMFFYNVSIDFNLDNNIDQGDIINFSKALGSRRGELKFIENADFNHDGIINADDFIIFNKTLETRPDNIFFGFNQTLGLFKWETNENFTGVYNVTFCCVKANNISFYDSETIIINIKNQADVINPGNGGDNGNGNGNAGGKINMPPILSPIGNKIIKIGEKLEFIVSGRDSDNDNITYFADKLPEKANFNNKTGKFYWITEQAGYFYINFSVNDGKLSDYEVIQIEVIESVGDNKNINDSDKDKNEKPINFIESNIFIIILIAIGICIIILVLILILYIIKKSRKKGINTYMQNENENKKIYELISSAKSFLKKKDIKNAKNAYKIIKELYNPATDKNRVIYNQMILIYKEILNLQSSN